MLKMTHAIYFNVLCYSCIIPWDHLELRDLLKEGLRERTCSGPIAVYKHSLYTNRLLSGQQHFFCHYFHYPTRWVLILRLPPMSSSPQLRMNDCILGVESDGWELHDVAKNRKKRKTYECCFMGDSQLFCQVFNGCELESSTARTYRAHLDGNWGGKKTKTKHCWLRSTLMWFCLSISVCFSNTHVHAHTHVSKATDLTQTGWMWA